MIRVLIAEDQGLVLGALAALLDLEPDLRVVAQARDGREALALTLKHTPDVLLTDIEMPRMTGLELAQAVQRHKLGAPASVTRVIIVTTFARGGYLRRALEAGAAGYLLKDAPAATLADAVRRVHSGGRAVDPDLAAAAWGEADPLSERERLCLRLAGQGHTSADIARELGLSDGTVRNYLSEALHKLGASNRVQAARFAREKGWL